MARAGLWQGPRRGRQDGQREDVGVLATRVHPNLQTEEAERIAQNEDLSSNLSAVNSDMLTKIDLEAKRMDQALNDQYQESTRQLNSMVDSLQDTKVDRKSLAALFSQLRRSLRARRRGYY